MGQHNNLHVHRWIAVAIFTLAILTSCTTPVSYTHLTLPTNREV